VSRITGTPFPQLVPKLDQVRTAKYRSVPPPPGAKNAMATTQGSWADAKSRRPRHRGPSPAVWLLTGIASVALVVLGILAFVRLRPPAAAVAGRAAIALSTGLSRLDQRLGELDAEREADVHDPEESTTKMPGLTLGPDDLPPVDDKPTPTKTPSPRTKPKTDPHGGVDSAGF
jgi:hypothetical protein